MRQASPCKSGEPTHNDGNVVPTVLGRSARAKDRQPPGLREAVISQIGAAAQQLPRLRDRASTDYSGYPRCEATKRNGEPAVPTLQRSAKLWIEKLAGVELERTGRRSLFVFDSAKPEDAWYSFRATLRSILTRHQVNHVIDVGANTGQFGQYLRAIYSGRISSFEPVSFAFEELSRTAGSDGKWSAYKLALGATPGVTTINVPAASNFSSLLTANDYCVSRFGERSAAARKEEVTVKRLDQVLEEIGGESAAAPQKIFLKMDTQGYDVEVFKGLGDKLQSVVAIQSEISLIPIYKEMPHWTESVATYEKAGFGVAGMYPVMRDAGRVVEYDCLLTRI
jgi:FkbM family methyltransferase